MKNQIIALVLMVVLAACVPQAPPAVEPIEPAPVSEVAPEEPEEPVEEPEEPVEEPEMEVEGPKVVEITVEAKQWEFVPATINVNEGDTVKLTVKSVDVPHELAIPTFGIDEYLTADSEVTVEFVADKKGEFPFYCATYCGRGHSDMTGTLVVN